MKNKILAYIIINIFLFTTITAQTSIALLKYNGGGDWYANPSSLTNLIKFCNENIKTNLSENYPTIEVGSSEIFLYPILLMTGHGNVVFSTQERENLRNYLIGGGFLHIDDNYGMDQYIRQEMLKVFPDLEWVELPYTHPIYHQTYSFPNGLPKVHEHDNKTPQGLGLFYENRLICFYSYECDLGDGWEDEAVHNDTYENRQKALKMGANIVEFVFMQ